MENHWCRGLFFAALAAVMSWGGGPALADDGLTIETALARVMANNPRLLAAEAAGQASLARIDQAYRRPNPQLGFGLEDLAGTGEFSGFKSSEMSLMLSQTFELGGKRAKRREQAEGVSRLVDWERRALRQELMYRTKEAFLEAWAAQSRLDLAHEQEDIFRELLEEFDRRIAAGAASTVELSRAKGKLASARMVGRIRTLELATACRRLASLWNSTEPDFTGVEGHYDDIRPPALSGDPADLLADNPALGMWKAQVVLQEANMNLAKAVGTIDLDLGLGVKHFAEFGDQALAVSAGVPLPVFDSNKDEVRAAEYDLEQVRRRGEALETDLLTEVAVSRQEARTALDEVTTLEDEIIPEAAKAFEATLEGHAQGYFTLTDVLETRQFLSELRETRIDVLVRYHLALANLRRLSGHAMTELSAVDERTSR